MTGITNTINHNTTDGGRTYCLLFEPLDGLKARKHEFDFTYEMLEYT